MKRHLLVSLVGLTLLDSGQGANGVIHPSPANSRTVTVEMRECRFVPSEITVKAGRITFEVRNPSKLPHVFQIIGPGVDSHIGLLPGGSTTLDVLLTMPGEYTLLCPIPTHPEQGMRGRIIVR